MNFTSSKEHTWHSFQRKTQIQCMSFGATALPSRVKILQQEIGDEGG